ncbi:hypothetical protein H6771_01860 [Candidatus Peribacteria bacterium]|nr:hypothetical protein [Candidatus Peribacteria bacterium]
MADTITTAQLQTTLAAVPVQEMLAEQAEKGIEASTEQASRVRKLLEEKLSVANFSLVDDLNAQFADFLQYDQMQQRLQILLEKATEAGKTQDIGGSLDDTMEEIQEITHAIDASTAEATSKFFGRIFAFFRNGFRSQSEIFLYGMRDLKGKVQVLENIIKAEKADIQSVVSLIREYLPAVTEDVVRLEYLDRFLTQLLASPEGAALSEDSRAFLKDYQVSLNAMKQVSSVSVLRIIMGLNRIVKAKFALDKVEMKFTMNLGTLVFENLIHNQIHSSYAVADAIHKGLEDLEHKNEILEKKSMQAEVDRKRQNLAVLQSLEGKLSDIRASYDAYATEIATVDKEVEDYLPVYEKAYKELTDMRQKALTRQHESGQAMQQLLQSQAFNEEALVAANEQVEAEAEALRTELITAS